MNKLLYILLLFLPFLSVSQVNQKDAKGQKQGVWNKKYPGSNTFIYKGQFKNNMMNGYGEFYWRDGKKYFGYYINDKMLWGLFFLKILVSHI
jgi:hypothetical protein